MTTEELENAQWGRRWLLRGSFHCWSSVCVCGGGFQEDSQVCGLGKAVSGMSPPGFERLADHLGMEM